MFKVTSLQQVLDCFHHQAIWGVTEMSTYLWKDRSLVHRYLKALLEQWKLEKQWAWPRTRYVLVEPAGVSLHEPEPVFFSLSYEDTVILDTWFYKFAPNGEVLQWKEWYMTWCTARGLDPEKKLEQFITIYTYIQKIKNTCWLLDVTASFREHIVWWSLDALYYADQYTWMEFGRWKVAEITFYAKDTQHKQLINTAIWLILRQLECLVVSSDVDALAFTPHSRKRQIQLLEELEKQLDTWDLPHIELVKYAPHGVVIAQKSLKTREQRIQNARETILIQTQGDLSQYKKVLLIDDFVGSGATLNETAKKLKKAGVEEVIGFAFVGNADLRYEVINEI